MHSLSKGVNLVMYHSLLPKYIKYLPSASLVSLQLKSNLHSVSFGRNLKLFSNENISEKKGLQVVQSDSKDHQPMVLLYTWMMAKESHALKYVKFYTERGFNVLKVRISPFDLLRPMKGSKIVAGNVLDFLHANPAFNPLVVHGFSVGAYVFCESMVKVEEDNAKHGELLKRFVGQIWDSPVDIDGIPRGLPRALTNNKVIQDSLEKNLKWYMKLNYNVATQHYERSSQMMHANTLAAPGLFIYSKSDPVSPPSMNERVYSKWEAKGYPVFTKCFENSPHVSHYYRHRKDYTMEVDAFLERVKVLEPTKGRVFVG